MSDNTILVINSGSSSIKYQLVNPVTGEALASGLVEQIGEKSAKVKHKTASEVKEIETVISDHIAGMAIVEKMFAEVGPNLETAGIIGVGHRVVQGGAHFGGPALIDEKTYALIEQLCPLAPLHNPANLKGIDAAKKILPDVPHVAVFDTAFFQNLPAESATYALDKTVAEEYQVRRYGAHGTSHQFISKTVAKFLDNDNLKQIVLHVGNGASASAVVAGKAVDTSMGLTPLEGLVMGTRSGDIDPAVVFHLYRVGNMSIDEIDNLLNKRSGMKGLCGSNDLRDVHTLIAEGNQDAKVALEVYVHRLLHYVGAYSAVMNGVDAITFTAGVGENDHIIREMLCERLSFLGVKLDREENAKRSGVPRVVSTPDSAVKILVVPTNEEYAIATQVLEVIS